MTFAPGALSSEVSVAVAGDLLVEADETFSLVLSGPVGATIADGQGLGTISDDDAPSLASRELTHGAAIIEDLGTGSGAAGTRVFRIAQSPRSSYEIALDAVAGDVSPVLERLAADNATVLQSAVSVGTGASLSLRWENTSGVAVTNQHVRVRSAGCASACDAGDRYRLRAWETTASVARLNNAGGQATVLVLQNATAEPLAGHVHFWRLDGTALLSHPFALGARASVVIDTSGLPGLGGQSGSITVSHAGAFGALAGKAVSLQPATGFAFDTPLARRPR